MIIAVSGSVQSAGRNRTVNWWRTTPGRIRIASSVIVALAVLAGVLGTATSLSRQHDTDVAVATAEPLVVDAQQIEVDLSDANTTMAGGFLAGAVVPSTAQTRFDNDLASAAASLTAASQRAGTGAVDSARLQSITIGLGSYQAIIATAETDNRQLLPVATAYLAEANNLMRTDLIPDASSLKRVEATRLTDDVKSASALSWLFVDLAALLVVLGAAIWLQWDLARRFRRVFNVPLLAASILLIGVLVWMTTAVASERTQADRATTQGSEPLVVLTTARTAAQEAAADDELTLITRDSDPSYQRDYPSESSLTDGLLRTPQRGWTGAEIEAQRAAAAAWEAYGFAHAATRVDDARGDLSAAIVNNQVSASRFAGATDRDLAGGVNSAVEAFTSADHAAEADLRLLAWGSLGLCVAAAILVLAGVAPRLREYR